MAGIPLTRPYEPILGDTLERLQRRNLAPTVENSSPRIRTSAVLRTTLSTFRFNFYRKDLFPDEHRSDNRCVRGRFLPIPSLGQEGFYAPCFLWLGTAGSEGNRLGYRDVAHEQDCTEPRPRRISVGTAFTNGAPLNLNRTANRIARHSHDPDLKRRATISSGAYMPTRMVALFLPRTRLRHSQEFPGGASRAEAPCRRSSVSSSERLRMGMDVRSLLRIFETPTEAKISSTCPRSRCETLRSPVKSRQQEKEFLDEREGKLGRLGSILDLEPALTWQPFDFQLT